MSRTYRKPRWYVEHSDASFVNFQLSMYRSVQYIRVRKPSDQYREEYNRAVIEFEHDVKLNGPNEQRMMYSWVEKRSASISVPKVFYPPSRYWYKEVPYSVDQCIKEALDKRKEQTRDGYLSETPRRSGYKKDSAREVRREWNKMKHKIINDEDYDSFYPADKIGKKYTWTYW